MVASSLRRSCRQHSLGTDATFEMSAVMSAEEGCDDACSDPALVDLIRACEAGDRKDAEREKLRKLNEPSPEVVADRAYAEMVRTVKRLAVEFDDIEKPGAFSMERNAKLNADVKEVGLALYALGGTAIMKTTIELYVSKRGALHRCFDTGFDGIGEWRS